MTPDNLDNVKQAKQQWKDKVYDPAIKRAPERQPVFETSSQIPVEPVYSPVELAGSDYVSDVGFPGEYPYTRGVQPTMYRGRFWTMRQYAGFGTAEESNQRYRYLLEHGQTGLSVAFDLPTQIGYDSDSALAAGEVGKVGVAISSLEDMETLFANIPLDKVSTSMTINSTAAILVALYIAVAKRQGVPAAKLNGTVQNDILKEYIARGTYIFPPRPSMRLVGDIIAYCGEHLPSWNTISISGYHIREAGSTAVQEVAFTLANGIAYVEACVERGLPVDSFGPRLSFFFNAHNDLFEEVAKFRAARRLWAKIMKVRFTAKDARSWMLRFHTQTAGSMLTAQQPENNVVRVTLQALAAVLGGTQSLHTNSYDEALALPSEKTVRIALRTQQIIAHESGVADTVDPLGGSYYVEKLTQDIERGAQEYLDRIDAMGGTLKALESGFFHREIQESAYRWQQEVEAKKRVVVGVNGYTIPEPPPSGLLRMDLVLGERQAAKLAALRARRDSEKVTALLAQLQAAAGTDANLMPHIVEAVENYVTLGEIADCLRGVFGEYRQAVEV